MKRIIKNIGMMVLVVLFCPLSPAQTMDCEDGQAACRTKCDILGLQEYSGGMVFTVDVWKERCRNACDKGAEACMAMSASAGCQGYFHHCRAQCPVTGGETDKAYDGTDAFYQCQNACAGGKTACGATNKKLNVARERKVLFNPDFAMQNPPRPLGLGQPIKPRRGLIATVEVNPDFILPWPWPARTRHNLVRKFSDDFAAPIEKFGFNICDETQSACKAQCAANVYVKDRGRQMQAAFYNECTNACGKSRANCAGRAMDSSTCGNGLRECYRHSPGTKFNQERNYYESATEDGEWFMGACEEAAEYCRSILDDQITNTTKVK